MKAILLLSLLFTAASNTTDHSIPLDNPVVHYIAAKYNVKADKIVDIVYRETDQDFPKPIDVLAIISIESEFKYKAVSSKGAKGLMQILYKKTSTIEQNIQAGVWLLKSYKKQLGSEQAAIHAYNIGIGNYQKGKRAYKYHKKYLLAKDVLSTII